MAAVSTKTGIAFLRHAAFSATIHPLAVPYIL
jgi:hypothetical protein